MFNAGIENNSGKIMNDFHSYDSVLPKRTHPQGNKMTVSDYMVAFSRQNESYCVGCVDIVSSTKIMKELGPEGAKYNQMFLNLMSKIMSRFGGFVIKNVGDCLLYYFPESIKSDRKFGFMSCIECCISMAESHDAICRKLHEEELPTIDYRISADYGKLILLKSEDSGLDMMGQPITMCSDINHEAPINGMVIGGDLYERVKNFSEYRFKQVKDFSLGFKLSYPIYTVTRK